MAKAKEMPTSPTHKEICEALWNLKETGKRDDKKKKRDSDESDG
jgi:hypothetical protein